MSRIGKLPINIPSGVDVTNNGQDISVKGKFGTLERTIPEIIEVEQTDGTLIVSVKKDTRTNKALHGLYRTLINNMIIGVSEH
jgi:large subunit ribosomal protein L6